MECQPVVRPIDELATTWHPMHGLFFRFLRAYLRQIATTRMWGYNLQGADREKRSWTTQP